MTDNKEREAFETWANDTFYSGLAVVSDTWNEERGMYSDYAHHMAWHAYRAALAASQEKAEPVASSGEWSVKPVSFGDIAHILDSAGNHVATVYTNEAKKIAAAHNAAPVAAQASEPDYKFMFEDAVRSLAAIDAALGIDPDEAGGAEPILEAIAELKAAPQPSAAAVRDAAYETAAISCEAHADELLPAESLELGAMRGFMLHQASRIRALKSAPPQHAEQPSAAPAALEAELIAALRWAIDEAHAQKLAGIAGPLSRILARTQGEQV